MVQQNREGAGPIDRSEYYQLNSLAYAPGTFVSPRVQRATKMLRKYTSPTSERSRRLLDIGCGDGTISLYLQKALGFETVLGADISQANVAAAASKGINAFQFDSDRQDLPIETSSVDAIFAGEVIEHLVDVDHLLQEVLRTLTDDGVFVLTTPNLAAWYNRMALAIGWQPIRASTSYKHEVGRPKVFRIGDFEHLRVYTRRAITELVAANGFDVLQVSGCTTKGEGVLLRKKFWPLLYADQVISRLLPSLASFNLIAARKR